MANVFIDTQVFVQRNFNFKHDYLFQQLINDSKDGLICIYLTEVVKKEVESKIHEQVYEKVKSSQSRFSKDAKILKNLSEYNNIFEISETLEQIYLKLLNQFYQFLEDGCVQIISVDEVSPSQIIKMYFDGNAPFSVKKKDEFPDAFSLVALENRFVEEKICIVSDDEDLKNFCEKSKNLIYQPSLKSLFDSLTRNNNYQHQFIISVYDANQDIILSEVENLFKDHHFILTPEEGNVEKVNVKEIELDEDPYIIDIEDDGEETIATIAFNANVQFFADIVFTDYSNSFYDKEEDEYLFLETITTEIEDDVTVPVLMKIRYKYHNKEDIDIFSSYLNDGEAIEVYFNLNDY